MPTYEYHCESCNRRYDRREGFDAATSHTCDSCQTGTAKRVLHVPMVVFKGSGFYVNDSKKSEKSTSSSSSEKSVSLPNGDSGSSDSGSSSSSDSSGGKSAKSSKSSSKD